MRSLFLFLRVAGAVAIVVALIGQVTNLVDLWDSADIEGRGTTIVNYFSYFTVDSNILTVVAFTYGAIRLARRLDDTPGFTLFRACVTTYMVITGTVYNLLLRNVQLDDGVAQAWSNEIVHVVGPILVALDWLFAPGRRRLEWKHVGVILIFPAVWTTYTMIRGPLVEGEVQGTDTWYPYPFLNPDEFATGYGGVAFFLVLIGVAFVTFGSLIVWISRRWTTPSAASS